MLTSFGEQGFLSDDAANVLREVSAKYPQWRSLSYKVNALAVYVQQQIEVHPEVLRELLVATLFARLLSHVQGGVLVLERGMNVQAGVLLRAALDSLFALGAVAQSNETARRFYNADILERERYLKKARELRDSHLKDAMRPYATDEKKEKIEEKKMAAKAKPCSTEFLAQKAGLTDWYLTAYAVLSGSVHSRVRDLESHLKLSETGELECILNEPNTSGLDSDWLLASEILLLSVKQVSDVFRLDIDRDYQEKYDKLSTLVGRSKLRAKT